MQRVVGICLAHLQDTIRSLMKPRCLIVQVVWCLALASLQPHTMHMGPQHKKHWQSGFGSSWLVWSLSAATQSQTYLLRGRMERSFGMTEAY